MDKRSCLAIILAAGEGKRMRSAMPKVMHRIGGLPMIGHVLVTARAVGADRVAVVISPDAAELRKFISTSNPDAAIYEQVERLGTADAVHAARKEFAAGPDDVLVLYGDTPLVRKGTLARMRTALARGADVVVVGFRTSNPEGYGRLITDGNQLVAIREDKDASPAERKIEFCNAGLMAFTGAIATQLKKIGNDNANGEFYLTDLVGVANRAKKTVVAIEADYDDQRGVNTRGELAEAESVFQARARAAAMANGATLMAPDSVHFSYDTRLGKDVVVEPNVFFGPGVVIADSVTVRAFSHLEEAHVGIGAVIGPFARLRPGAVIGEKARVGNFVEVKNAAIDRGAKVNHLTYVGDTHVGAGANVGAGTITCNYDGIEKHHTEIGEGAFIGSNSALVAPVTIGRNAYVASGSVITEDVPDEAMAVARGRQVNKPGWVAKWRETKGKGR